MSSFGRRLFTVFWSAFLALLILIIGQVWNILLIANFGQGASIPWSIPVMVVVLWLIWRYLGGKGWPHSTSEIRKRLLRANHVSSRGFLAACTAGGFAIIALAGYWIVFFRLVRTPPNVLPDVSKYPWLTVVLVLAMSSLVSPIVEEIGFRGYCQKTLEREFTGPTAVAISSLFFMLAHANHGWFWPKLLVYFLAGITFGAIAYLTNSIITSIPVHVAGDVIFFTLVWPHDATRRVVTQGGSDAWFWIHIVQAATFTTLALLAFRRLAKYSTPEPRHSRAANITAG